jgi:hypothetical protein
MISPLGQEPPCQHKKSGIFSAAFPEPGFWTVRGFSAMVDKSQVSDALHFLEAFPEAQSFNVVCPTQEKRIVVNRERCSRHELNTNLQAWMAMTSVHFFIRPLLRSLVMVDLDDYKGNLATVLRLNPRAVVCTSPGNYQVPGGNDFPYMYVPPTSILNSIRICG